jgi:hypothetical protein
MNNEHYCGAVQAQNSHSLKGYYFSLSGVDSDKNCYNDLVTLLRLRCVRSGYAEVGSLPTAVIGNTR